MKWMKERDLLIAQTMAFVQSVTGKMPEAEKTVVAPVALFSIEATEPSRIEASEPSSTSAALPDSAAIPDTATLPHIAALADIKSLLAETPSATRAPRELSREAPGEAPREASRETPREISRTIPIVRPDVREDIQAEIKARVANFRAHQERFSREREAYCSATMARVHASIEDGNPSTRPGSK
jgi:hypothetical protein